MGDNDQHHWKSPVRITTPEGTIEVIRGPEEALAVLPQVWPEADDEHFSQAKRACLAALSRSKTLEEARYTFMGACRDANID
ncbi:DUF982 domain-containing protein [Mycoplana sp. BE70]|uniref:DUF982 domain-containing protein n=1 Tax=Mycoplana sp. BE70 TaxID=2817775 RepID=UPI0038620D4B